MNDILVDNNGAVMVANGDFATGFSTPQHKKHLLLFTKGSLKENITVGVGAAVYLEAEDDAGLFREILIQLTGDGMKDVQVLRNEQGLLEILGDY